MAQKSYKPTAAMVANAKRGLAAREKSPDSQKGGFDAKEAKQEGVGSGVARARDIINGSLSLDSVKRMYSFLSRAETYYKPKERTASGNLTPGTQAYLLWGGSAALAWSRKILREEGIVKSYKAEITEEETNKEEVIKGFHFGIEKAENEELKQVTYVAMLPDSVDLHGDFTSADEVRKACENFNRNHVSSNLFHRVMTNSFSILESYLAPTDFILGDNLVTKGTWLVTLQIHDDNLWELVKSGEINGVSIGALARVENLEEEEDDN